MKVRIGFVVWILLCLLLPGASRLNAQTGPAFRELQRLTNRDVILTLSGTNGLHYRIDASTNLPFWDGLLTLRSTGTDQHTDSAAPYLDSRFYRALELSGTNIVTGDHLSTTNGEVVIHPLYHASFVLTWSGIVIYNDPDDDPQYESRYAGLPKADLILVSHNHSDHFSDAKITALRNTNTIIIAPTLVYNALNTVSRSQAIRLSNGGSTNVLGMKIEAIPAYNANHPQGEGNGYVLTMAGKRIYITGDTGNTAQMRALTNIHTAFVCMNIPYTMTVNEGTNAVRAFRPAVVYPYHYRNQSGTLTNAAYFKQILGTDPGIEVRLRQWY